MNLYATNIEFSVICGIIFVKIGSQYKTLEG